MNTGDFPVGCTIEWRDLTVAPAGRIQRGVVLEIADRYGASCIIVDHLRSDGTSSGRKRRVRPWMKPQVVAAART